MAGSKYIQIVDTATPKLRAMGQLSASIPPRIGAAVAGFIKDWLFKLDQRGSKSGFPSQHFYSAAAKGTTWRADAVSATISINKQGFRQRLQGGTIRPVNVKLLTIPARSEAAGKRALEFGNLKMQWGKRKDGSIGPVALVAGEGGATQKKFRARNDTAAERPVKGLEQGVVVFWLVKEVTQQGDKDILPSDEQIRACAEKTMQTEVERILARK